MPFRLAGFLIRPFQHGRNAGDMLKKVEIFFLFRAADNFAGFICLRKAGALVHPRLNGIAIQSLCIRALRSFTIRKLKMTGNDAGNRNVFIKRIPSKRVPLQSNLYLFQLPVSGM